MFHVRLTLSYLIYKALHNLSKEMSKSILWYYVPLSFESIENRIDFVRYDDSAHQKLRKPIVGWIGPFLSLTRTDIRMLYRSNTDTGLKEKKKQQKQNKSVVYVPVSVAYQAAPAPAAPVRLAVRTGARLPDRAAAAAAVAATVAAAAAALAALGLAM